MKNIVKTLVLTGIISWQAQANKENNLSYEKLLPQYVSWAIAIDHKGLKIGISLNKKEIKAMMIQRMVSILLKKTSIMFLY